MLKDVARILVLAVVGLAFLGLAAYMEPECVDRRQGVEILQALHSLKRVTTHFNAPFQAVDLHDDCSMADSLYAPAHGLQSLHLYDKYVAAVEHMLCDVETSRFPNFKREPEYQKVLEHVTPTEGRGYVENIDAWLKRNNVDANALPLADIARLDQIGNPVKHAFRLHGGVEVEVSPTMMRYMWYAMDYSDHLHRHGVATAVVAEVGAGYAGQYLMWQLLSPLLRVRIVRYFIFDLEPVQRLQMKYVQRFAGGLDGVLTWANVSTWVPQHVDLLVSNYALSELSPARQRLYWTRLVPYVAHGYLAKNGALVKCKTTVEALARATIKDEHPKTGWGNEIVMW